jgi:hypothetical protein
MSKDYAKFAAVFDRANREGYAAAEAHKPSAMVVSSSTERWFVPEGVCGFAWVRVRPGNSSFAKWLVKNKLAHKAYTGGVDIWISAHGQSLERKERHAGKMASILKDELGINAYADSRMD